MMLIVDLYNYSQIIEIAAIILDGKNIYNQQKKVALKPSKLYTIYMQYVASMLASKKEHKVIDWEIYKYERNTETFDLFLSKSKFQKFQYFLNIYSNHNEKFTLSISIKNIIILCWNGPEGIDKAKQKYHPH